MANVRPFTACKPADGYAEKIASLPYDVYSRNEACEEVKDKPLSFLRIDRAETAFDSTVDTYSSLTGRLGKMPFILPLTHVPLSARIVDRAVDGTSSVDRSRDMNYVMIGCLRKKRR